MGPEIRDNFLQSQGIHTCEIDKEEGTFPDLACAFIAEICDVKNSSMEYDDPLKVTAVVKVVGRNEDKLSCRTPIYRTDAFYTKWSPKLLCSSADCIL